MSVATKSPNTVVFVFVFVFLVVVLLLLLFFIVSTIHSLMYRVIEFKAISMALFMKPLKCPSEPRI